MNWDLYKVENKKSKTTFFASLKEAKENCESYYEKSGQLRNCTCGQCPIKESGAK